ncbi:MAG TPA: serine hydrolase, partial [Terriglobales bacterium]
MYNPRFMRTAILVCVLWLSLFAVSQTPAASANAGAPHIVGRPAQSELLWEKLDSTVQQVNRDLNGTMGVALMDLTDGHTLLLNPDAIFTQASSIKVAVLAELYRQQQEFEQGGAGKAKLTDLYTVNAHDIVADS